MKMQQAYVFHHSWVKHHFISADCLHESEQWQWASGIRSQTAQSSPHHVSEERFHDCQATRPWCLWRRRVCQEKKTLFQASACPSLGKVGKTVFVQANGQQLSGMNTCIDTRFLKDSPSSHALSFQATSAQPLAPAMELMEKDPLCSGDQLKRINSSPR
jgi:hypothetical protein